MDGQLVSLHVLMMERSIKLTTFSIQVPESPGTARGTQERWLESSDEARAAEPYEPEAARRELRSDVIAADELPHAHYNRAVHLYRLIPISYCFNDHGGGILGVMHDHMGSKRLCMAVVNYCSENILEDYTCKLVAKMRKECTIQQSMTVCLVSFPNTE